MDIKLLNIDDIKPYDNNPRNNGDAVDKVANSIKEFGFKVPIVIDKNNVIVTGHTRRLASIKLGLKQVPCIKADDLSDEKIKAFRLADNKVSEFALWDDKKLNAELISMPTFDFEQFGFEVPQIDFDIDLSGEGLIEMPKENERMRTVKTYNMHLLDEEDTTTNKWGIPPLDAVDYIPSDLISFNYAKTSTDYEKGIHFYIDDYQFERIWNSPLENLERIETFDCVLTADFSLYLDMPLAMKMWNVYRSRALGRFWQNEGLIVIPTLQWAERETFEFCFDGLPQNSTVSVSTIGVKRSEEGFNVWCEGMDEAIRRLKPKNILLYGGMVDYDFKDINVVEYKNHVTDRMSGE